MSLGGFDPEILQDFLTEAGELLEQLEGDLVCLERAPDDPELLNKVFRALHTIKGSASFLALTNLVEIAHAAESALNAARNQAVVVDAQAMNLLLGAVDVVRHQMEQVRDGAEPARADPALVEALVELGRGGQAGVAAPHGARAGAPRPPAQHPHGASARPLDLSPAKADLLEYLVADLNKTMERVDGELTRLAEEASRPAAAAALAAHADALVRSVDFFEFEPMTRLARALVVIADHVAAMDEESIAQLLPRARVVATLLAEQSRGLADRSLLEWPLDGLLGRVEDLAHGRAVAAAQRVAPDADPEVVLAVDGVLARGASDAGACTGDTGVTPGPGPSRDDPGASDRPDRGVPRPAGADPTIRVEVGRLETLMNLVGELVLQKNRVAALSRRVHGAGAIDHDLVESFTLAAGSLDRVTGDIQLAVMRTRMQPLEKLFGRYPRLIRDLSQKTGKKIDLVIEGGETEVDRSVIEELGDPLVHLLRNAADHGIEMPAERLGAGKPGAGMIRLVASHEGSHVRVLVVDDGRGLQRERIARKAVERGMAPEAEIAAMGDREIFRFIFAAGFSTADRVSDLSGRGVGMDVVRTNIERLKGTIELWSEAGRGTTIAIKIPLTVAIMPAMMVGVADEVYAIPLGAVLEIVRPEAHQLSTIGEHPVMRLRDSVLPLVSGAELFGVPPERRGETPFAVVVALNEKRMGLLVSRLIGQQEIVIKGLDEVCDRSGPISGATVRDDGGVSLIVDVGRMIGIAQERRPRA